MNEDDDDEMFFELFGLRFPVHTKLIIRLAIAVWISLAVILLIAQTFFQYEMTNADIPGGLISGFLLAYLISILIK